MFSCNFTNNLISLEDSTPKHLLRCLHAPQCLLRQTHPPPIGPRTFLQAELDTELSKKEAIEAFTAKVLDFLKQEEGETLDYNILKLEAL